MVSRRRHSSFKVCAVESAIAVALGISTGELAPAYIASPCALLCRFGSADVHVGGAARAKPQAAHAYSPMLHARHSAGEHNHRAHNLLRSRRNLQRVGLWGRGASVRTGARIVALCLSAAKFASAACGALAEPLQPDQDTQILAAFARPAPKQPL